MLLSSLLFVSGAEAAQDDSASSPARKSSTCSLGAQNLGMGNVLGSCPSLVPSVDLLIALRSNESQRYAHTA